MDPIPTDPLPPSAVLGAVPYLVVVDGVVVAASEAVEREIGCDPKPMLGPLAEIGQRLEDTTFDELCRDDAHLRVRLGPLLDDRPIRLRHLGTDGASTWLEVRSLADEFRMESLLRRSGLGHMLISPRVELQWSMTSNDLADVFPGDDPMNWVELMDPDDMHELGSAIIAVGADPNLRRTVRHRLNADRTYTIIDTIESAVHDPDLRAVLVRSRLEDALLADAKDGAATYAGITVSDHMPIGVVTASSSGTVLHRNAVAAELVGARIGQPLLPAGDVPWMLSRLDPGQTEDYQAVFASAVAGVRAHCTIPSPSDPARWLRVSVSPAAASTVVMTIEDTTELAEAEGALRASNRLLEALDSHSEDLVIVFDATGRSRYTSSSVRRHFGEADSIEHADEIIGFVHPPDSGIVDDLVSRVRASPSASGEVEFRVELGGGGAGRWHHATMTNLLDDPDVQGMVLTLRDVHERHLADRALQYQATHDSLTALPDRAALQSRLDALLSDAVADGHRTALVFCDIDSFKQINDRAGHRIGDLVLTEVAARLRSSLRSSDFVGRFGGDEFVVVAPDIDDDAHALAVAERVFAAVSGPTRCDGIDVDISVSIGVAVSEAGSSTAEELLHRADLAMYQSKHQGRGRVSLHDPSGAG